MQVTEYVAVDNDKIIILSNTGKWLVKLDVNTIENPEEDGKACNRYCKLFNYCNLIHVDIDGYSIRDICNEISRIDGKDFYINEEHEKVVALLKGKVVKKKNRGI